MAYSNKRRERLTAEQVAALPDIIMTDEAAGILGVCDPTIIRYARNGYVSGARVGRTWRFNKRSVLEAAGIR